MVVATTPLPVPFQIVVDGREVMNYTFGGIRGDSRDSYRPLAVTWRWGHLRTGDYSVLGFESRCAVERKSLVDLYGTIASGRVRFRREHERLAEMEFAAVVIEASLGRVIQCPPPRTRLLPKVVYRTALHWMCEYRVPWIFCDDRRMGEITTFRLLARWWELLAEMK